MRASGRSLILSEGRRLGEEDKSYIWVGLRQHSFMYSNFRLVGIKIWNYITDHVDINITPKIYSKIYIQTNDFELL